MHVPFLHEELVDREQQNQRLRELYDECVNDTCQAAVISGPIACGKTSLLFQFADWAAQSGAIVLSATASRSERMLPLGVIDQLIYSNTRRTDAGERISHILADVLADSWHNAMLGDDEQQNAQALRRLCGLILGLTELAPVVLAVDDVQHADLPSQQCLASLILRLRGSRSLLLITENGSEEPSEPLVQAGLRRGRHGRSIEVGPLSRSAVAQLLARHPGLDDPLLAQDAYSLTGGNPALLRALIEDLLPPVPALPAPTAALKPGPAFAEAFRACLSRAEATALRVAQGLAVLGERGRPEVLPRLLDLAASTVDQATELLDQARLLGGGRFRHPAARNAVLAGMEPGELAAMHAVAAQLMHRAGEPAITVSHHLTRADRVESRWGVAVLMEAAEQALAAGHIEHALLCLRASEEFYEDMDENRQAEILNVLCRAKGRVDPAELVRHLPVLLAAERDGRLDLTQCASLVHDLLWHDRPEQALEILERLCESWVSSGAEAHSTLDSAVLWAVYSFPAQADQARKCWARLGHAATADGSDPLGDTATSAVLAAAAIENVMVGGRLDTVVTLATRALELIPAEEDSLAPAVVALSVLLHTDRTETAATWCDTMLAGERTSRVAMWQAMLFATRAEAALLRGELRAAQSSALKALDTISAQGWGSALGGVLATLILTSIEFCDHDAAAGFLNLAQPAGMMRTPFGVKYVHARGSYFLATGRIHAAQSDFRLCAELVADFGLDLPGLVPWRTSLAQAHLAAQEPDRARQLASEQLRLLGDCQSRLRGLSLRVLASASEPKNRLPLLREAVELLRAGGDRLETARAHADIGDALRDNGEANRARLAQRTAHSIATCCQALSLLRRLDQRERDSAGQSDGSTRSASAGSSSTELTEAERRVAELAALGHTNVEIACSLYVTVSTVEQHLTRVYRKLGFTRRTDVPRRPAT